MSYENAPATRMLATHCAVCRRPLLDAQSVELGIGPDCRKKHGFNLQVNEVTRAAANKIVFHIAVGFQKLEDLKAALTELHMLGFARLSGIIAARRSAVKVTNIPSVMQLGRMTEARIAVLAPYSESSLYDFRRVPGRRWEPTLKANTFPGDQKTRNAVNGIFKKHWPGELGVGPKGLFTVGGETAPVAHPDEQAMQDMEAAADRAQTAREDAAKWARIEADEQAREHRKSMFAGNDEHDGFGCPGCGCPEYHDGEACPHTES